MVTRWPVISFWLIKVCIKQISFLASSKALFIQNGINRSEISTIIQVLFTDNHNSNANFNCGLGNWLNYFILVSCSLAVLVIYWYVNAGNNFWPPYVSHALQTYSPNVEILWRLRKQQGPEKPWEEKVPCFLWFAHCYVGTGCSIMDAICACFPHSPIFMVGNLQILSLTCFWFIFLYIIFWSNMCLVNTL